MWVSSFLISIQLMPSWVGKKIMVRVNLGTIPHENDFVLVALSESLGNTQLSTITTGYRATMPVSTPTQG